jgi:peroxiredoxin
VNEPTRRLQDEIDETMAAITPEPLLALIDALVADLETSDATPGLPVGASAPGFTLPAADGSAVTLADRLAEGPVVLSFYRGAWCPVCNIEMRTLQEGLGDITSRGASLVAVSPQAPDDSLSFAERMELGFTVLSDLDQAVAEAYRVRFRLTDELIDQYTEWGLLLPEQNADGSWHLPVPATYVIDNDGTIRARHVEPDYRRRMDPDVILAALDAI